MNTTALALRPVALPVPSVGSLDAYIRSVSFIPVFSADEERALAERLHQHNDLQAAQQLVLGNLRFVVHIARGYMGYGLQLADLIQEGNIGLMKAVKRFDSKVGVRLISFAVHWIRAEIHEFILKNWRIVKIATTKAQRKLFFNLRSAKQRLGWLHDDEVKAVAKDLRVKPEEVLEMEQRLAGQDLAFHAAPHDGESEDEAYGPENYLQADDSANPAHAIAEAESSDVQIEKLQGALAQLDARARDVLRQRWLVPDKKTGLRELADHYGVSAERIRQIEVAALKKLRVELVAA
ncbi:MAG: RNA polymerase sigma factor RpoH [Nevskiales bacterium]